MKISHRKLAWGAGIILLFVGMNCSLFTFTPPSITISINDPTGVAAPTEPAAPTLPSAQDQPTATTQPQATHPPAITQPPTGTAPPVQSQPTAGIAECFADLCVLPGHFPFGRPIPPPHQMNIDHSYRFGSDEHGKRDTHYGVEFLNSAGTPVVAAANGVVVVAGDDKKVKYSQFYNYYGNLIVLQHEIAGIPEPVYTLYAHLSKIDVRVGDSVEMGEKIGEVGSTGGATGSHLHFEVRYGENDYRSARNPELWLEPLHDENGQLSGALAGKIYNVNGKPIFVNNVVIESLSSPNKYYLNTYTDFKLDDQPPWYESFGIGSLPPGEYKISFIRGSIHQRLLQVEPGQLTVVTFQLDH